MILDPFYRAAIFFPCHPYIWSTTVLHDDLARLEWHCITYGAVCCRNLILSCRIFQQHRSTGTILSAALQPLKLPPRVKIVTIKRDIFANYRCNSIALSSRQIALSSRTIALSLRSYRAIFATNRAIFATNHAKCDL